MKLQLPLLVATTLLLGAVSAPASSEALADNSLIVGPVSLPASSTEPSGAVVDPITVLQTVVAVGINARDILDAVSDALWADWYCQFADGTVAYNQFRFYRNGMDVAMYFAGHPGSHDCDARYQDPNGNVGTFCTQYAREFAWAHGGIVAIGTY